MAWIKEELCDDKTIAFSRLLKDSEIIEAIKKGLIVLKNPEVYLQEQRDNLIQPASMDLVLKAIDPWERVEINGMDAKDVESLYHPELDNSFVTFWPGYQTETLVKHLTGHNIYLFPAIELRSTLRRVGLDTGFVRRLGFDYDSAFVWIRNPNSYPVSVKKGQKICQITWVDRGYTEATDGFGIRERNPKYGSGIRITSNDQIRKLVDSGDLYLSELESICNGRILFRAGRVKTYGSQKHVIIDSGKIQGFDISRQEAINHVINPGEFSDIETIERIGLSNRVAMQVFYHPKPIHRARTHEEMLNSFNTIHSSGGWVDPGYGQDVPGGAPFSVQRKAFTEPITISEGQVVGYGFLWFFPEPVEKRYSSKRGSHYNDAKSFVGPVV